MQNDVMATPGFTYHLSDLLAQLQRLSGLLTNPSRGSLIPPSTAPAVWSDPYRCIEKAGWRVSDYAFFHHVDILRPYGLPAPLLTVDEGLLLPVLESLMKSAIEASADKGAVVCHLHRDGRGLRICICDSSGVSAGHILQLATGSRLSLMREVALEVDAMGGTLLVACHPDEGVVVELLFPPDRLVERTCFLPASAAANDAGLKGHGHRKRP